MLAELQLVRRADAKASSRAAGAGGVESAGTLVERARAGDSEAFQTIFNRHARPVFGFIYNGIGNRDLAEELLQETFVRAYRRLDTVRDEALLATWLFGIARNVVREAIKEKYRCKRNVALESGLDVADGAARPDAAVISADLAAEMRRVLGALKEDQRVVFVLKLLYDMSYEQIGRITGSSIGKLKTDLHRARLEMRRRLRPYLGDAADGR